MTCYVDANEIGFFQFCSYSVVTLLEKLRNSQFNDTLYVLSLKGSHVIPVEIVC